MQNLVVLLGTLLLMACQTSNADVVPNQFDLIFANRIVLIWKKIRCQVESYRRAGVDQLQNKCVSAFYISNLTLIGDSIITWHNR